MANQVERKRNWAIYILFFVAVAAAILAFVDAGRYMGWIPVNATIPGLGEISFMNPGASWIPALMSAFIGAIWLLVATWLWTLNPSGWMFVIVISVINLIFLALAVLGRTTFSQVLPAVVINGLAMFLALLPSTREAFMPRRAIVEEAPAAKPAVSRTPEASAAEAEKVAAAAVVAEEVEAALKAAEPDVAAAPPVAINAVSAEAIAAAEAAAPREDAPKTKAEPMRIDLALTMVEGVGPKTAEALEAAGINSIYKLAAVSGEELTNILRDAGLTGNPATWQKQAQMAAAGDLVALKAYQDELVGGREVS